MRIFCFLYFISLCNFISSQSVGLVINSIGSNTIAVTPSFSAGSSPVYLGNFDLGFQLSGSSNTILNVEYNSGGSLNSFNNTVVDVDLTPSNTATSFILNFTPANFVNQTQFDSRIALVPINTTAALGSFTITFSGTPNGTIICGTQNVQGFANVTPWNQSPVSVSCNVSLSILPITLSTFSAIKHSERSSKLDWTTSSEINSDYFGIERSRDGDTWETISQVAAAGNSSEEKYYKYIDDKLPFSRSKDQIFYYRLRLTDQDGSFKYSDIKGVNFNRQTADGVIAVYPNPATQMVHIDVVGMDESQGETKLRIFDMFGRVMLDKAILGSGLEPVDVLQYPSGVYNISVTQGDKLHQKQFIKVE